MIKLCPNCGAHMLSVDVSCPHCHIGKRNARNLSLLPAILGLSLVGCGDKGEETGELNSNSNVEDTWDGNVEPPYGVGAMDEDGDGFHYSDDCDDQDASVYPGAAEYDSEMECMKDTDQDGYGDSGTGLFVSGSDCNDDNPNINPSATDTPNDGVDQNCDGIE